MGIKIAVVGGGSSYTPELFADLIEGYGPGEVERVSLTDINAAKLSVIADVSQRLLAKCGSQMRVEATTDLREAIGGADFVILQVRVGGLEARIRDEMLPREFGMVGNETTGPGGFVCALRTVPVALEVAREIERSAPNAWLLNLTNPAGIITEALLKHAKVRTIGFCNIPINTTYAIAGLLGVDPHKVELHSFGLNHLSWTREAWVDGQERLQPLIASALDRGSALYRAGLVEELIEPDWLQIIKMIPSWYLRYFYYPEQVMAQDRRRQTDGKADQRAEEKLGRLYAREGYGEAARGILASKGGAQYYLPVLQAMRSIVEDRGDVVVLDTRNGATLPDLAADACVEVPARVRNSGVEPLPIGGMPLTVRGLVQVVKSYEELTVEAAVSGDPEAALAALVSHPLVPSYAKAADFWQRALQNEGPRLPQFKAKLN